MGDAAHGLPESDDPPFPGSLAAFNTGAEELIAGNTQSIGEYGAIASPGAAELQAAPTAAKDEQDDIAPGDTARRVAQSALDAE